jgi:hypothetical protein
VQLWRDRSALERGRFGSPLGSLRTAEGGKSGVKMPRNDWAVWLTEDGGERFLGLAPTSTHVGRRRFCVLGKFQSDGPNGVGVWMDVDFVQEIEIPSNAVLKTWQVNPRSCLILWGQIAYVQRGERRGKIGFTVSDSK